MAERHVWVDTPDGKMETFIAQPDGAGPFAAVVMFQNVGGLSEILRNMARRVAQEGYYCAVPDLYYRLGKIVIDADATGEHVMAVRRAVLASISNAAVMADTRALLTHLAKDPAVRRGPKGTIGYCMGGRFAPLAAGTFPEEFVATAGLFPVALMTDKPDSPHRLLDRVRGELYFGCAEHDHAMSLDDVKSLERYLAEHCKARFQVELHPGTEHGYAFPGRRVYHREASELSWSRIFDMFRRQLAA
jgi:carboxymethylenebutenolidase